MADESIDVRGLTCPKPLVETKKKIRKMEVGKVLEVIGDHGPSKIEIPEMLEEAGNEIMDVSESEGVWKITILKKEV